MTQKTLHRARRMPFTALALYGQLCGNNPSQKATGEAESLKRAKFRAKGLEARHSGLCLFLWHSGRLNQEHGRFEANKNYVKTERDKRVTRERRSRALWESRQS